MKGRKWKGGRGGGRDKGGVVRRTELGVEWEAEGGAHDPKLSGNIKRGCIPREWISLNSFHSD